MQQTVLPRWQQRNLSYILPQSNIDTSHLNIGSTCPPLESLDHSGSDII